MPIAAVVSREDKDVTSDLIAMLKGMGLNKRMFTAVTENGRVWAEKPDSLSLGESHVAIGRCSSFKDGTPAYSGGEVAVVLDGHLFNSGHNLPDCKLVSGLVERKIRLGSLFEAIRAAVAELDGAFSFAALAGHKVVVAQDMFGFEPLFWGEDKGRIAIAAERKALWRIKIKTVARFPAGCVMSMGNGDMRIARVLNFVRPRKANMELTEASCGLAEVLSLSLSHDSRSGGPKSRVGVLFSGGVDSSVVAALCGKAGLEPTLYCAAVEGSRDVEIVERAASELGFRARLRVIPIGDIEHFLRKTLFAIEEVDLMEAAIGIPFYAALELAKEEGVDQVFSGQGADELFGGYARYQQMANEENEKLSNALWSDLCRLSEGSLGKHGAVAAVNNVGLYMPFLRPRVMEFAAGLPVSLKISGKEDSLRKHVLREAARLIGVPELIVLRPKKAVQYSSGSEAAIRRQAKRCDESPNKYMWRIFEEVLREYMVG